MVMEAIANSMETKGGQWCYYRQPNGWITVSVATTVERMQYIEQGWTPLLQYGHVEMTTKWAADHPFEALFLAGGAHELPAAQIIELGYYFNKPMLPSCGRRLNQYHKLHNPGCFQNMQPVVFPQLDGYNLQPWKCRHCSEVRATEAGRDQHETVAHKTEKGDIKMAESLAAALNQRDEPTPTTAQPVNVAEELEALRAEIAALKAKRGRRAKDAD